MAVGLFNLGLVQVPDPEKEVFYLINCFVVLFAITINYTVIRSKTWTEWRQNLFTSLLLFGRVLAIQRDLPKVVFLMIKGALPAASRLNWYIPFKILEFGGMFGVYGTNMAMMIMYSVAIHRTSSSSMSHQNAQGRLDAMKYLVYGLVCLYWVGSMCMSLTHNAIVELPGYVLASSIGQQVYSDMFSVPIVSLYFVVTLVSMFYNFLHRKMTLRDNTMQNYKDLFLFFAAVTLVFNVPLDSLLVLSILFTPSAVLPTLVASIMLTSLESLPIGWYYFRYMHSEIKRGTSTVDSKSTKPVTSKSGKA